MNFELITNPIALLSNKASIITPSCISILSSPILIVTSLNMFSWFRLQMDIFSATLLNLFVLEHNQKPLGSLLHLNCSLYSNCPHTLLSFLGLQFLIFYNSAQDGQILHSYNYFFPYLYSLQQGLFLLYLFFLYFLIGGFWQLLHSFSLLLLLEQALLAPTIKSLLIFLTILGAVASVAVMPLYCFALELELYFLIALSTFLPLICSLSNFYLMQLSYYTIAQLRSVAALTSWVCSVLFYSFLFWTPLLMASLHICCPYYSSKLLYEFLHHFSSLL